ncbi:hypothetical protein GCK72_020581 [Caenorhabditis remanei]|uniref:GH18 domain-containing protein n=1 Tax=Caenorhabditis remanei TaxID=31234 RepID=A0A6A5GH59_CAERE|nr:hypothetical protein GCK72_020581 [Caenorhabditis remanei]KAF1754023.1 hypothetical protein GCK72_020581 [Caenorhabditis remanei]
MAENLRATADDQLLENGKRNRTSKRSTLATLAVLLVILAVLAIGFLTFLLHFNHPAHNRDCKKRVIGYYDDTDSAEIRESYLEKLTHVVFSHQFLSVNGTIEFKTHRTKLRFEKLRNKAKGCALKVMISIGHELHSFLDNSTEFDRSKLSDSIVSFLEENQADGVDLFWKWATTSDKSSYLLFVKELRLKLLEKNKEYIFSVTAAPKGIPDNWAVSFDLEDIIKHVDFMNIFSMDFFTPWRWQTGPTAPLYHDIAPRENFTVDYTMNFYACKLKETSKLNLVIPMDASIWRNVKTEQTESEVFRNVERVNGKEINATIYKSRRLATESGIKFEAAAWDEKTKTSYMFDEKSRTFSSFENKKSIEAKLNYVNEKNLGGVWLRSLNMDDGTVSLLSDVNFSNYCSAKSIDKINYHCSL